MEEWDEEDQMICHVMEKVFETIESTLFQRLEANVELEEELLQNRKSQVEDLVTRTSSLKADHSLWTLLDTNVFRSSLQSTGS